MVKDKELDGYNKIMNTMKFYSTAIKEISLLNYPIIKLMCRTDAMPRIIWDNNNTILEASQPFLDGLGYEREDVVGHKWYDRVTGKSEFMSEESIKTSLNAVIRNLKNGDIMIDVSDNTWYNKEGKEVGISWELGFNQSKTGIGSAQCRFINKKNRLIYGEKEYKNGCN